MFDANVVVIILNIIAPCHIFYCVVRSKNLPNASHLILSLQI